MQTRFVVSFVVEVQHQEGDPSDATESVAELVTEVVDEALKKGKGTIKGPGVKITDAVMFAAEVE